MGASRTHLKNCFNEGYGRFRVDRVAVGAQASHTGGKSMTQRECAGFNWPGRSISAGDPVGAGPHARRATSFSGRAFVPQRSCVAPFQSRAEHVGQGPATKATVRRDESVLPASLLPFWAGVPAIGVGQPASCTTSFRFAKPGDPLPSALQRARIAAICSGVLAPALSCLCGVGHEPQTLADMRRADT